MPVEQAGQFSITKDDAAWEMSWAPYDEASYQVVLANIRPEDIVLDIGAGDLRLTRRIAEVAQLVYAIEIQKNLIDQACSFANPRLPGNLVVIHGDARRLSFPCGVTAAVLLMRHCQNFELYFNKLEGVRCERLITNARWRFDPEVLYFQGQRIPFEELSMGWYACRCGGVGFKPGCVEMLTPELEANVHEVGGCPSCTKNIP